MTILVPDAEPATPAEGSRTLCPEAEAAFREVMKWHGWAKQGKAARLVEAMDELAEILAEQQGIQFEQYA